jgi:hypothetical protein
MKRLHVYTLAVCILAAFQVSSAQDGRFVVFGAGKHGYIDEKGTLVIPIGLEQTYVIDFSEGLAAFSRRAKPAAGKSMYVDDKGKFHIFPREKWGFIDAGGKVVVVARFDAVQEFSEDLAAVGFDTDKAVYNCFDCETDRRWGFIDKKGQTVIQPQYRNASSFSEGLAAVQNDAGKWGYINTQGAVVIPFLFKVARDFRQGLAVAAVDGQKCGYIDKSGSFVIKPRFSVAGDFSEGLAAVRVGGKTNFVVIGPAGGRWSFIGRDGSTKIKLPRDVEDVRDFSEGLAVLSDRKGRCGYMATSGAQAIPMHFSWCDSFSEGLADVESGGKWQYLDKVGNVVLTVPYWGAHPFRHGLAAVEEGSVGRHQKFGYIDKSGNVVWKPRVAL